MSDTVLDAPRAVAPEVAHVADNFVALMRAFNRTRARMLAAAEHDIEWSSHVLLRCLANEGPMRASAIAECLQSDPSTVSRQVAALVRDGLLERRADPVDGRASLLVLTPRADVVLAEHDEIRLRHFATMLEEWPARDLQRFATLLHRFTNDFENANHQALSERIASRSAQHAAAGEDDLMSATTNPAVSTPSDPDGLSHKQILTILSGLILGMFLAALDQMIVSTAIRTIGDDLHGLSVQAWVTTAFLITSTISTLLFGKLSDIYGRKPFFMLAISIFILGSALCGLAHSMYQLAAFRAFQGIGAGGLFPLALAIIGDIIPPRERARYQGYFMAVFATASVLGPIIGGFFAGQSSILGISGWRWIFYINVPIGILALVVVEAVLKLDHTRRAHRIDWGGAGALVVGVVPLLIIAEQGRTWGWGGGSAYVCYVLGALGLGGFVWTEIKMGDEALLPMRLFRNGVFAIGSAQSFIIGMGMFGGMVSIPLYLQIVKGASPTKAGLLLLPMVAGIMGASLLSGQVTSRTGRYKIFPVVGGGLLVVGMLLLSRVGADTALWQTDLCMVVFGAGLGMNMQTIVLAMQNSVPPRDMGVATSATTFFRQVGGSLGTAVFLTILFTAAGSNISAELAKSHVQVPAGTSFSLNDTSALQSLPAQVQHPILVGFSNAMDTVFLVGACVLVFAFVLAVFMKEVPLRTVSGNQARKAEEEAARAATKV